MAIPYDQISLISRMPDVLSMEFDGKAALPDQLVAVNDTQAYTALYAVLRSAMHTNVLPLCRFCMVIEDAVCSGKHNDETIFVEASGAFAVVCGYYVVTYGILVDLHTGTAVRAVSDMVAIPLDVQRAYVSGCGSGNGSGKSGKPWTLFAAGFKGDRAGRNNLIERLSVLMHETITNWALFCKPVLAAVVHHPQHKGVPFVDVMPALGAHHATLAKLATSRVSVHLQLQLAGVKTVDAIIPLASRGHLCLPVITQTSMWSDATKVCPAFKSGAIPDDATISTEYTKEYSAKESVPETLCMHKDTRLDGKSVLILDDVIATGGSLCAAVRLARGLGAVVVGAVVVRAIPDLFGGALARLHGVGVPLFVLLPHE